MELFWEYFGACCGYFRRMNGGTSKPLYPVEHSFVIALRRDCEEFPSAGAGRGEHLASGRSADFEQLPDLLRFIAVQIELSGSMKQRAP